jgi:putative ABC transport system ATP-binding protein
MGDHSMNEPTNASGVLIYHLREVKKIREAEEASFRLSVPSLQIGLGEKIALIGESGCGKSTLLDMLAFLSSPTEAASFRFRPESETESLDVVNYWKQGKLNQLGDLRKQQMGYVLQTGGLLPYLTVQENLSLSRRLLHMPDDSTVEDLSHDLGINRHLNKLPSQLSTGERQRVAIGRALAHRPSIVIADEPTASLDPMAAENIMALFIELVESMNITVIVASHAWHHVKRLGLRRLSLTSQVASDGVSETVVIG